MVREKPAWLEGLIAETFFVVCGFHENHRKNEKNVFCLECCLSICPHCLPSHTSHPLLQVRRYVYHDVVRLDDLEKLIDCSCIQPYTINSAKVLFLKQRPQSRPSKCPSDICSTCERILQEPFQFCSLSCKVDHMVSGGEDLSGIIYYTFDKSHFSYTDEVEGSRSDGCSSFCSDAMGSSHGFFDAGGLKKKKGSSRILPGIPSLGSKRKGNPHRSPFF
ncbi:protein RGF1 INDUCIBLE TRANSCRIPTION FACTOR 1 [Malania oleifera]|uniref:protein RGF1 INDUCIBLE TRANSCRIPTION FACTOR 1 n=1 Tax=Malania oleifera TaxID=397392 RepID=UPI0025ADD0FC|nr:protein RGF1 INDUCIBLE TRANSCRIPTION FACTOR 1 [Malania oleifera]